MPRAHTLRRWLWRANAVLVLGVLAVWALAVPGAKDTRPLPEYAPPPAAAPMPLGPDIPHEEAVALPVAEARPDDRLPLRAFEVRMRYRDQAGPGATLLLVLVTESLAPIGCEMG